MMFFFSTGMGLLTPNLTKFVRLLRHVIASLRIIVEQTIEWNTSLYINFVDYEKALDSLDREQLEDLGFADDLALLSHSQLQMQT
jgi:hypothetical protein